MSAAEPARSRFTPGMVTVTRPWFEVRCGFPDCHHENVLTTNRDLAYTCQEQYIAWHMRKGDQHAERRRAEPAEETR